MSKNCPEPKVEKVDKGKGKGKFGDTVNPKKCTYCNKNGHLIEDCWVKQKAGKEAGADKPGGLCNYCSKPGHTGAECRTAKREREASVPPGGDKATKWKNNDGDSNIVD